MSIEAMKLALEALENAAKDATDYQSIDLDATGAAISLLRAALSQQPATPEPVQADSSEHLRVIASLGAALRRLSFAAQTTGGTDGPDAELQSAIGQAEQALSLGGIWQAMSATGETVADVRCEGCGYMTHHREHMGCVRAAKQHTHPAPSVPADVVRVPLQVLKDASEALGNFVSDHGWGDTDMQAMDNLDAYIARHDAKAQKGLP